MKKVQDTHKNEIETVSRIFKKSGIRFLPEIKIKIKNNKTDIDIFAIYKNIILFVECFGTYDFGPKLKKTLTDFKLNKDSFEEVKKILKKDYPTFYSVHKDFLEGPSLNFRYVAVSSKKETLKEIDGTHLSMAQKEKVKIWTMEEVYYYDKVSDCTYEHCRYEIFGHLDILPSDIVKKEESNIPSYPAYGKEISKDVFLLNLVIQIRVLLKRSTIKRLRDSSADDGYQRLLNKNKLKSMRNYLLKENSYTYPNNIICVLNKNSTIHPVRELMEDIKFKAGEKKRSDNIKDIKNNLFLIDVPNTYDVFEIVDGQHRLFSFTQDNYISFEKVKESDKTKVKEEDDKIRALADNQSLTVTVIYSQKEDAWSNPGKLFLDINTKQTNINSEDIIDMVEKYDKEDNEPVIQANLLLKKLNEEGFLRNKIKFKPWQDERIKRVSLITYSGLKEMFDQKKKTYKIFWNAYKKQKKIGNFWDFCFIITNNYLESLGKYLKSKNQKKFEGEIYLDMSLKDYYFLSAVYIGALFRLLRHFLCGDKNKFNITESIEDSLVERKNGGDSVNKNIGNEKLQNLFKEGVKTIVDNYSFTKEEFTKQEGWGSNKWAKIESDLFYLIRNKKEKNFGEELLISKNHRKLSN